MYHNYFGIEEQAFSIAVNPRYMYMSVQHKEALAHLLYGVNSGGFVMLSGEVGTGKTTIIRCLLEQLPAEADLAIVLNPSANAHDLICSICDELNITYDPSEKSTKILIDALSEFLIENHHSGRKTIVLIDEAQLLRVSTLEQVRLLTNLETNTQKLLQIILVGQPELNDLLAKPALRQLSQRITARYHLRPLDELETEAYIKHRLVVAGMPPGRDPFNKSTYKHIHRITHGIPRLINVLCDRMLLGAYSRDTTEINTDICKQAAIEVLGELPSAPETNLQHWIIAGSTAAMVCLLMGVLFWLWFGGDKTAVEPVQSAQPTPPVAPQITPPVTPSSASGNYWHYNQTDAVREVASALNIELFGGAAPCEQLSLLGWACETQKIATWQELKSLDRAGILTIVTEGRQQAYIALVGLQDNTGWVQSSTGVYTVNLQQLGRMWTGDYLYLWRKPTGFSKTIGKGVKGPIVKWVAESFAVLDQQTAPLTQEFFNEQLQERVKLFQQTHSLKADGFVGLQTLLKLNSELGLETPLSKIHPSNSKPNDPNPRG